MSKIINLFGGPGIGKSAIAAGIFYNLKKQHISCNNPYEFPKSLAWDSNTPAIKDQLYVFANQHRGIAQSYGKVDYIIVDSPILFSKIYSNYYTKGYPSSFYGETFNTFVLELYNRYDNLNILLERVEGVHNEEERFQNYGESLTIDKFCKVVLEQDKIPYYTVKVGEKTVENILKLL